MTTTPITPEEIQLWQESTPVDYNEWDLETVADCDAFLTIALERIALPLWTKITDDPNTWPRVTEEVMLVKLDSIFSVWHEPVIRSWGGPKTYNLGSYWRALGPFDYPPTEKPE